MYIRPYEEIWRPKIQHPERARLEAAGYKDWEVTSVLTNRLLINVLHAAGGIEYTVANLERLIAEDEAWAPPGPVDRDVWGIVGPNRNATYYEITNLFFWLKVLEERIKSRGGSVGHVHELGLLPALAVGEPWTKRVRDLFGALHSRTLGDIRLVNFATHVSAFPRTFGAFEMTSAGARVPIPDTPPQGRLYLEGDLTFEEERDARTFAREALAAVDTFIDGLLYAFEEANAEIIRRRTAENGPPPDRLPMVRDA
jgi:hypothetical protein